MSAWFCQTFLYPYSQQVGSISKKGHLSPPKQKTAVGQQHSVKISALHIKCIALNGMSFGTQMQFDFSSAVYRQTKRSVSFLNAEYGSKEKGLINTRKPLQTFQMPFHNSVSQLQPDLSCNTPYYPSACLWCMYHHLLLLLSVYSALFFCLPGGVSIWTALRHWGDKLARGKQWAGREGREESWCVEGKSEGGSWWDRAARWADIWGGEHCDTGESRKWESEGGGAGRVVGVAGVRGGQAADKVGAGMKNGWMGESSSHREERWWLRRGSNGRGFKTQHDVCTWRWLAVERGAQEARSLSLVSVDVVRKSGEFHLQSSFLLHADDFGGPKPDEHQYSWGFKSNMSAYDVDHNWSGRPRSR